MGIALLAITGLFNRLSTSPRTATTLPQRRPARIHPVWAQRTALCTPTPAAQDEPKPTQRTPSPLRIMCIHDKDQARASAGRMVISGRMADVCAELDRLVALEARQPSA